MQATATHVPLTATITGLYGAASMLQRGTQPSLPTTALPTFRLYLPVRQLVKHRVSR